MRISKRQLLEVLAERVNVGVITKGYTYNLYTIRCKEIEVAEVVQQLREKKAEIERLYKERIVAFFPSCQSRADAFQLLNFVCIPLQRVVWVPIPHTTNLNVLSKIIRDLCPDLSCNLPVWS